MEFIDPSSNPAAYEYAFCSAIREHLLVLKEQTRLRDLLNKEDDDMNMEPDVSSTTATINHHDSEVGAPADKTRLSLEAKDMIYYLESVIEFVIGDLLKYHTMQDVEQRKNWGFPSKALSNHYSLILLGPELHDMDVPSTITTSLLIRKAMARTKITKLQASHYHVERDDELGKVFYSILRNTFHYHWQFNANHQNSLTLSAIVALYLQQVATTFPKIFDNRNYLVERLDKVISELTKYSKVDGDFTSLSQLYEGFKLHLKNHLELLLSTKGSLTNYLPIVMKLREQGNNLMSNSAYAQAIKVYTEATNYCIAESLNSLPQLLINRAIAFIGLTCFPEAINDLNKALTYDIVSIPAWVQLGYAQLYMGNSLIALKCYLMAIKCSAGIILPLNFPNDESLIEEYKVSKIKSTLPQFIEQLLKGVQLTETRALQQRQSETEIQDTIDDIKACLEILKQDVQEIDQSCFIYPPVSEAPSSFHSLVNRVNLSRPSILNHEVNQGVIAGTDSGNNARGGGRPTAIAIETRIGTPRTEITRTDEEPSALGRVERAAANAAATAAFANNSPNSGRNQRSRSTSNTENNNANNSDAGDLGTGINNNNGAAPTSGARNFRPGFRSRSGTGSEEPRSAFGGFSQFFEQNEGLRPTREGGNGLRTADALRGILPEEVSDNILNVINSFTGFGGQGEVVITRGAYGGNNTNNNNNTNDSTTSTTTTPATNGGTATPSDNAPAPGATNTNNVGGSEEDIMSQPDDLD